MNDPLVRRPQASLEAASGPIVLLGPQSDYSEIAGVLTTLGVGQTGVGQTGVGQTGEEQAGAGGPVALITAGWQENEGEDDALARALGHDTINLALHARSERVFAEDPTFAKASAARQKHLQHLQDFYRIRLDAIDDADSAIAVRHVDPDLLEEQRHISAEQLRHIDADHLARCGAIHERFDRTWRPDERPSVLRQREEIAAALEGCAAVVIAGGHVVALLNRLRLFNVLELVGRRPIVAWSAGAMTLTERIVLFHDSPPFGKNLAQVLDRGLGLCPGVVVLPDMSRRVRLDAHDKNARFTERMAPAHCLALDPGSRLVFEDRRMVEVQAARIGPRGHVEQEWYR